MGLLHVHIIVRALNNKVKILVEDDGVGFGHSSLIKKEGLGTGLKNSEERLKLHYGELGKFEVSERIGGGTSVSLEIPLKIESGIL